MTEDPSELARRLAAHRKMVAFVCVVCGADRQATTRRLYCSNRCKLIAFRQRQKAARAQGEPPHPTP